MLARRGPKLALSVPALNASVAAKSPLPRTPISPTPISPTVRNTRLNQRGFATLQPPTFAYSQCSNTKSILKKGQSTSAGKKQLSFKEETSVRSIERLPEECYGAYVKMSKDERRWGKGQ